MPARRLLPLIALLLTVPAVRAQTGSVFGTVNEIAGDQYYPIAFARVTLDGEAHRIPAVVPDIEGKFTIEAVPEGLYSLRVTAVGFAPLSRQIKVSDGDSIKVRIRMGDKSIAGILLDSDGELTEGQHLGGSDG